MARNGKCRQIKLLVAIVSDDRCDASAVIRTVGNARYFISISRGRWEDSLRLDALKRCIVSDNASCTVVNDAMYKREEMALLMEQIMLHARGTNC